MSQKLNENNSIQFTLVDKQTYNTFTKRILREKKILSHAATNKLASWSNEIFPRPAKSGGFFWQMFTHKFKKKKTH